VPVLGTDGTFYSVVSIAAPDIRIGVARRASARGPERL